MKKFNDVSGEQAMLPGMPKPSAYEIRKADEITAIAARIEDERERRLWTDALACARDVALACLPRSRTDEKTVTKEIQYAPGCKVKVKYSVPDDSEMPFGSDRFVLFGIQHLAREQDDPVVTFETAGQLLDMFDLSKDGREYRLLRERFERLRSLSIEIETTGMAVEGGAGRIGLGARLIEKWHLPNGSGEKARAGKMPFFVTLSDSVFSRLQKGSDDENILLLRLDLLKLFVRNPRGWDFAAFLCHRCGSAQRTSVVPHDFLMQFFKNGSTEPDRVTIAALRKIHKQIMAATGGALKSEFIEVGKDRSGPGRPRKIWGLQARPSRAVIIGGKGRFKEV